MRGLHVKAMMLAGGPDFVEQEGAGDFEGAVQVVGEAAFFAARGSDQSAELRFKHAFLTFFGPEYNYQGYGVFGELGAPARWSTTSGFTCGGCFLPFALRHGGGDFTPIGRKEKAARTGGKTAVLQSGGKPPHSKKREFCRAGGEEAYFS